MKSMKARPLMTTVGLKDVLELAASAVLAALAGAPGASAAQAASDAIFTKITTGSVVTDSGVSWSGAWADYDGDGFLDLFVTNGGSNNASNFLYHNNGDGSFTRVLNSTLVQDRSDFHGCAWVDWNNDGYPDLAVVTDGFGNFLYQNNGDGSFTKLTNNDIVSDSVQTSSVVAWGDFDRDGYLDCFIGNFQNNPNSLYRNLGNGTFLKVTAGASVADSATAAGAAWVDYNKDGWPDLFVSNFQAGENLLYRNAGLAGFTKMTSVDAGSIITDADRAGGCAWGDYDNDGYPDVYLTSLSNPAQPGWLYHNNGDGTFTHVTDPKTGSILTDVTKGAGCAWADYDNDGYLDLFVARIGYRNLLYHNNGDGTFTGVETGAPVEDNGAGINSWSVAWGDYNNDGFLDILVANGGSAVAVAQPNSLYKNNGNANAWIKIRCEGTASNRSGIGAKVRIKAVIAGKEVWQLREISHGGGWSSSPREAHFGLGDATNISTIRIEWPSGTVQTVENVRPKQSLVLTEPVRLSIAPSGRVSVPSWPGQAFEVEASGNLLDWSAGFSITNLTGSLQFPTLSSTNSVRFFRVRAQ
jgi:hypothetical protein